RYREEAKRLIERVDQSLTPARERAEKLLAERVEREERLEKAKKKRAEREADDEDHDDEEPAPPSSARAESPDEEERA
ncbi:MAG TPA: hypothetical protein VF103_17885, partial [Polyangiaceae bacterium]